MMQKPLQAGSLSNTGCVRQHNEDSLIAEAPLFAVADGMGGHAAGEVASQIAIDILAQEGQHIYNSQTLISTVRTINRSIIQAAASGTGRPGMGTTLTLAVVDGTRMLIAQVGDSRAYLLHKGSLQQLTRDHSYVSELLAGGHISEDEAAHHPKRSVITRALGSDPKTEADIYELNAEVGDRLLLCSDGLYGMVSAEDITAILAGQADPQTACEALIAAARAGGGLDNISAIVVDISHAQSEFVEFSSSEDQASGRLAGSAQRKSNRGSRSRSTRKVHFGVISFVVLLVLFIGIAVAGVYWYASNTAFLRTNESGIVEVYRGLPGEVLPGVHLEWYEYTTEVDAADLVSSTAARLEEGIQVDSLNDAASVVANYEMQIQEETTSSSSGSQASQNANDSTSQQNSSQTGSSARPSQAD